MRNLVYYHVLDIQVDFTNKYGEDAFDGSAHEHPGILSPKLNVPYDLLSLLLVSKQISVETGAHYRRRSIETWNLLNTSMIDGKMNKKLSAEFLTVCSNGRFIFYGASLALSCISSLPIKNLVQSIVIGGHLVVAGEFSFEPDSALYWSRRDDGEEFSLFTRTLRSQLPSLKEVALFVGVPDRFGWDGWYCTSALCEMFVMLERGEISTLRLFYPKEYAVDFDIRNLPGVRGLIRPEAEPFPCREWEDFLRQQRASNLLPARLVVRREETNCRIPDAKTVISPRLPDSAPDISRTA